MEGKNLTVATKRLMMKKKHSTKLVSKTIVKKKKGARSTTKKGKLLGTHKTDSSQPGIGQFLCKGKKLIGALGMDIGIGRMNSLGNSKLHIKLSSKK